ncbi:MAG TPA: hypothetical protein PKA74_05090 [Bauldia sp.]|nr:hypothetical protein [Bauldia sp.]
MQGLDTEYFRPVTGQGSGSARPLLPVGFHRATLPQVKRLCVEGFTTSVSRPLLMQTLGGIIDLLNRGGFPAVLWVEGAFLTDSENPPTFDATLVLTEEVLSRLTPSQADLVDWFCTTTLADSYRCNNYMVVLDAARRDGTIMRAYWLRQFGLDTADGGGVLEILIPSLVR